MNLSLPHEALIVLPNVSTCTRSFTIQLKIAHSFHCLGYFYSALTDDSKVFVYQSTLVLLLYSTLCCEVRLFLWLNVSNELVNQNVDTSSAGARKKSETISFSTVPKVYEQILSWDKHRTAHSVRLFVREVVTKQMGFLSNKNIVYMASMRSRGIVAAKTFTEKALD